MLKMPPTKVLIGATIVSISICAFSLRANNQHMLQLRDVVYSADKSGTGVQESLINLQAYVTAHMNTDLSSGRNGVYPPIQLQYSYERLVRQRSEMLATTNSQTYSAAQSYCEQQNPTDFSGRNRVPCIEEYVQSHGVALAPIPDALYKFSFASPAWSPDLAGLSLVTSIMLALITVAFSLVRRFRR